MDSNISSNFHATKEDGIDNENFSIINSKIIIIGGTGYTGEIKKEFSVLNFTLPVQKNVLPMHCSANSGENGDTSIFFGLSGTGKLLCQLTLQKINWG